MYRDILIPTDGSTASVTALEHGTEIASSMDATVYLLHVVDVGTEMSAASVGDIADDLTETLDGSSLPVISTMRGVPWY